MTDVTPGPAATCPWCSAALPDPAAERCPSCDATLTDKASEAGEIKGVTTLDPDAISRARTEASRGGLLGFIGGAAADSASPASPESLAPPPDEVRREMLRLQIEAERADLTAETVALRSDELSKLGIHLSQLGGDEEVLATGEAPAAENGAAPEAVAHDEPADAPAGDEPDAAPAPPPPPPSA